MGGDGMGTYRAKKRGCLKIEGVPVPFDKGMNVCALAEQVPAKVIENLIEQSIWEDVTVQIKEAEKLMSDQLKKIEKARKSKAKK